MPPACRSVSLLMPKYNEDPRPFSDDLQNRKHKHWRRIRTNNPLERILREIRRRTRVVGAFPDGRSALNLAADKFRHIAGTAWPTKRYLNIELLKDQMNGAITA
jgi:transposase-like protein